MKALVGALTAGGLLLVGVAAISGTTTGDGPAGAGAAAGVAVAAPAPPAWFVPLALAAQARFGIPAALLAAVADVESGFRPEAVGPPVPGGPALGMMQFLPSTWQAFSVVPGATPFDPGPAVLAAAKDLRYSGATPSGWDVRRALFGYNHSDAYVAEVLAVAVRYGW